MLVPASSAIISDTPCAGFFERVLKWSARPFQVFCTMRDIARARFPDRIREVNVLFALCRFGHEEEKVTIGDRTLRRHMEIGPRGGDRNCLSAVTMQ